jgi:hypothetical protein
VLNYKTVFSVIEIAEELNRLQKGAVERKNRAPHVDFIKEKISLDCLTPLRSIKRFLDEEMNINVSLTTIHKRIREFNFSFKRVTLIPVARNTS